MSGTSSAPPIATPAGLSHRQILTILSGLMMGMFLASLDQTIVSTAIRTISDDLHGLSEQAWATTAYLITSTISTPLYGKLSDLYGRKPFFLAAITIAVGVVPLLLVAEQGQTWGWTSLRSLACFAIGIIGVIAWILIERRMGDDALIPMRLFGNKVFSRTSLLSVLVGAGMFGGMLMIPQYLQIVKGASPTKSGLLMLPLMLGMMSASIATGQLIARTGRYKIFPMIGTALMTIAMVLFQLEVQWNTPLLETMVYMLLLGIGLGFTMQTLTLAVQNAVPAQDMGVATASATFFRQLGATAGTAIFLSVLFSNVGGKIQSAFTSAAKTPAFQAAVHDPSVMANPANQPVVEMLRHPGASGGGSTAVLNDSSFIQKLTGVFADPFKQGFADSMHTVFMLGAIVTAVAFVLVFFIKEVPLRKVSAMQARAQDAAAAKEPVEAAWVPEEPSI